MPIEDITSDPTKFPQKVNSFLDFQPLIEEWDKLADPEDPSACLYHDFKKRLEVFPALLQSPVNLDELKLRENKLGFSVILSSLFPLSGQEEKKIFGISLPFNFDPIYATPAYKRYFAGEDGKMKISENLDLNKLTNNKLLHVYSLILKQIYGIEINPIHPFIFRINDERGLVKFFQININTEFVRVKANGSVPSTNPGEEMCENQSISQYDLEKWMQILPLDQFEFHGFMLHEAQDITESQSMAVLNEALLRHEDIGHQEFMRLVDQSVKGLLDRADIFVGLAFLQKVNGKLLLSEKRLEHSHIIRYLCMNMSEENYETINAFVSQIERPTFLTDLADENSEFDLLREVGKMGIQEVILYPLKHNGRTIGLLEVCASQKNSFDPSMMNSLDYLAPTLSMGLDRQAEVLEKRIDSIIKKNFTAIHPVVGWKFEDIALDYVLSQDKGDTPEIKPILFSDVYPLFAAVDIRNSSEERNRAIQNDFLIQLEFAKKVLIQAKEGFFLPILDRLIDKVESYIERINLIMVSDEEVRVTTFFQQELEPTFKHLSESNPNVGPMIQEYFEMIDSSEKVINTNREKFEISLQSINQSVAGYLESQEEIIQKIFPHYFEKFKTDGVEYNMYIGQSLVNKQKFDPLYLKNLRLWQIQSMIDIVQLMEKEGKDLAIDLQTTQLILAHNHPITISFRLDERKFDVEGAYNIRYEVIKKRIDKARILATKERLTQPGKIAIVYSHTSEAEEYADYISYFQHKGLLALDIEELELEEMQGVYGMKALRVTVLPEAGETHNSSSKLIAQRKEG